MLSLSLRLFSFTFHILSNIFKINIFPKRGYFEFEGLIKYKTWSTFGWTEMATNFQNVCISLNIRLSLYCRPVIPVAVTRTDDNKINSIFTNFGNMAREKFENLCTRQSVSA